MVWVLAATFSQSVGGAAHKVVVVEVPSVQTLVFMRAVGALILLLPVVLASRGRAIQTRGFTLHVIRGVLIGNLRLRLLQPEVTDTHLWGSYEKVSVRGQRKVSDDAIRHPARACPTAHYPGLPPRRRARWPRQAPLTSRSLHRRRTCASHGHSGAVRHLPFFWQTIGLLNEVSDATIIGGRARGRRVSTPHHSRNCPLGKTTPTSGSTLPASVR
jgi:hypothetical protein